MWGFEKSTTRLIPGTSLDNHHQFPYHSLWLKLQQKRDCQEKVSPPSEFPLQIQAKPVTGNLFLIGPSKTNP